MQKKTPNLGLFSGLPPFISEEADREQLSRGPQLLGQSIASKMVELSRATKADPPMQKLPLNLGLFNGLPKYTSEEEVLEQLKRGPKLSGPSIASTMVRLAKQQETERLSERNPKS